MAKRKNHFYAYKESRFSTRGIAALILGLVSFLFLAVLTALAIYLQDGIGLVGGSFGVTAFSIAFIGMILGLKSFHDRCRSYLPSKIGTLLCAFMVAAWFLLFCVGMAG